MKANPSRFSCGTISFAGFICTRYVTIVESAVPPAAVLGALSASCMRSAKLRVLCCRESRQPAF